MYQKTVVSEPGTYSEKQIAGLRRDAAFLGQADKSKSVLDHRKKLLKALNKP